MKGREILEWVIQTAQPPAKRDLTRQSALEDFAKPVTVRLDRQRGPKK